MEYIPVPFSPESTSLALRAGMFRASRDISLRLLAGFVIVCHVFAT
jgi:hypothetical protein